MNLPIKKILFKATIIFPLVTVFYIYSFPIQIYIGEIRFSLWERILPLMFLLFTMFWLCVSPIQYGCKKGDWFELLFNLFPVEVLLFIVFAQWHFLAAVLILATMIGTIVYFAFQVLKKEDGRDLTTKERRLNRIIFERLFVLISFVFLIVPSILSVFVYDLKDPHFEARQDFLEQVSSDGLSEKSDGDIYSNHQQLLSYFREESWKALSVEDRITLLQALANMESDKLGMPPTKVVTEKLDPFVCGTHSRVDDVISIDMEHIQDDTIEEVLNTCLHETYHAYQTYVVNHVDWDSDFSSCALFDESRLWKDNQSNYIRGSIDYEAYEDQPVEASARQFAEDEVASIMAYIAGSNK